MRRHTPPAAPVPAPRRALVILVVLIVVVLLSLAGYQFADLMGFCSPAPLRCGSIWR